MDGDIAVSVAWLVLQQLMLAPGLAVVAAAGNDQRPAVAHLGIPFKGVAPDWALVVPDGDEGVVRRVALQGHGSCGAAERQTWARSAPAHPIVMGEGEILVA